MNSKITLLLLSLFSIVGYSQDKTYDLLKNKTQTNILYDRVYNISDAANSKRKEITTNQFLQTYHEIQRADFNNRLPKLEAVQNQANLGFAQNQIPLSVLISDFETIKKSEIDTKNVFLNSNNQMEIKSGIANPFEKHSINLIGALLQKSKTNQVDFILKNNLIFNTTDRTITSIAVNYDDSKAWKNINQNQAFRINFTKNGNQIINFKLTLSTGEIIEQSITFDVDCPKFVASNKNSATELLAPNVINTIAATIPYQGYGETASFLGQAEYEIFPDTVDGILDKPIFLLDGFDPGDARNIPGIYSLLNYGTTGQNLGDIVRAQGYDLVILNFPTYTRTGTTTVVDGGVDYIQRNAMILVELINQINAQKVGTAQNVVIGPSMGGLISRYALRYMEQNNLTHDTRLYISFDSPHLGANVPIGFQHLFNYMGFGPVGDVTMQALVNGMLKSPAAREMLIDHFEGHLQTGSVTEFNTAAATLVPTGCPNYRTAFQNELNAMGFPSTTRNVSIANGAGNGTMTGTPGMVVMNHTFNITTTQRAIINLNFTPSIAQNIIEVSHFKGQTNLIFWFTVYESLAKSKAPTYTDGLDSAPGGRFDMNSLAGLGTGNALLTEFMNNLNIMYFDFIPVWSSMGISGTSNLYSPVTASSVTPFAASSIPITNENHVTLTATNVAFALNEILNAVLSTSQNLGLNSIWIKNPIENAIQINSNYAIENATISVTDILGKTIFNTSNVTINGMLEIPVSLSNGVYLITIKTDKESVVKKVVKE
ncbi:T9SS type A sorting domain-containing protein [Flavobacterium sp. SUN052]|uniref:T9SS type A sorting domain-containing protein n=1 Tax=Flavobacterium sp. SUN052 TaxID=3002441 RepID=UPI00237DA346|nr:T9SS type A sorting domain-containing protein [Flavobacterium sp. SUN052]MEC4003124.1 T9SS type A sorting domain-containing protein [Flavobacterium sp. SUN052]